MRRDVHNWAEMYQAIMEMTPFDSAEPRIIVLHDTAQRTYRFISGIHGLVKIDSDKQGEEL